MKRKILLASRILLSIVAFVVAGNRTEGLSLMVQQISSVGARQWLGLMVGLTILNYGFPIVHLLATPQTNVPAVFVGAER